MQGKELTLTSPNITYNDMQGFIDNCQTQAEKFVRSDAFKTINNIVKVFAITTHESKIVIGNYLYKHRKQVIASAELYNSLENSFTEMVRSITVSVPKYIDKQISNNQTIYTPQPQIQTRPIIDVRPEYILDYDEYRQEVKLNNEIIAKPRFDSENQVIIEYLFNNPNRNITLQELQERALDGCKVKKTLHQVLRDLKIKGDVKQRFFNVNKSTIKYTP